MRNLVTNTDLITNTNIVVVPHLGDSIDHTDIIMEKNTELANSGDLHFSKDTYRIANNLTLASGIRLVFEQRALISVDGIAISAITKANPGEVTTSSAHGFNNGDKVRFKDVGGMTELNHATNGNVEYTVTVVSTTKFTIGVNTTGYGTYANGGYAQHILTINGKIDAGITQIFTGEGAIAFGGEIKEVYPQWWGAVKNGSTADHIPIQKAIDAVIASGGGIVHLTEGTYLMRNAVQIRGNNVSFVGRSGATLKVHAEVNSTLSVNLTLGASTATLTDASGFAIGDGIKFNDGNSISDEFLYTIINIVDNVITFTPEAKQAYQVAETATCYLVPSLIEVSANDLVTEVEDISVTGLTLDGNKENITHRINWNGSGGIHLWKANRVKVEQCRIINTKNDSIQTCNCSNIDIVDTHIENCGYYGIHWGSFSHDCTFRNGSIKNSDSDPILWCAGGYNCKAIDSVFEQTSSRKNMHAGGDSLYPDYQNTISGNTFRNVGIWIDGGVTNAQRTAIINNSFIFNIVQAVGSWCIYVASSSGTAGIPENLVIDNNLIIDIQVSPTLSYGIYLKYVFGMMPRHATISNNVILNCNFDDGHGIFLNGVEDVNILGNYIAGCKNAIWASAAKRCDISNNTIGIVKDGCMICRFCGFNQCG